MFFHSKKFVTAVACTSLLMAASQGVLATEHKVTGGDLAAKQHTKTHTQKPHPKAEEKGKKVSENDSAEWKKEAIRLSSFILPKEQYEKLRSGIAENAWTLLKAHAESEGVNLEGNAQKNLTASVGKKFSRQYFDEKNLAAMTGKLSLQDVKKITAFYESPEGKKWLSTSPKIVEQTMGDLHKELTAWVQNEVSTTVAGHKRVKPTR